MSIRVCLGSTVLAVDFVSLLPKEMGLMSTVGLVIKLVDARALDIGRESRLIGPLVNALATSSAAQIPFGFFKGVGTAWLLLGLLLKHCLLYTSPSPRDA